eukprot:7255172-Ditylum_brightwellii.AAC.1
MLDVIEDDVMPERRSFITNERENVSEISGIWWRKQSNNEYENKFFCNGAIATKEETTLDIYPIAVLGIGNMEWQSLALGKENASSCHCNHCQQTQDNFSNGVAEPWTLQRLKEATEVYCINYPERVQQGLKTLPVDYNA